MGTLRTIGLAVLLAGCAAPTLPPPSADRALLVMGFSTELVQSYEGGHLYTGFSATTLDDHPLDPALARGDTLALARGDTLALAPGDHHLQGQCYWRLRGTLTFPDDLLEPGSLEWRARPGYRYTLASDIDEYKMQCRLSVIEQPWD